MTVHSSKVFTAALRAVSDGAGTKGVYSAGLKRVLDVAIVLAALPIVLPFFLIVMAITAADGQSPFFRQERVGRNGQRFLIWKFRTMVPDAEGRLQKHLAANPDAHAEWQTMQKLQNDPRITRVGRVLRRTSIDELPQLINVLAGDMSLVGPRPMLPSQQAIYSGHAYYRLRPGLTGIWQVEQRHNSTFADRANYDDSYEAQLSFINDVKILARTIGVVFRGTGV